MNTNQIKTVGLIPSKTLISLQQDINGNFIEIPEGQVVVPLVKLPKPEFDPLTQKVELFLVWSEDKVERNWILSSLSPEEQLAANRKVWKSSVDYLIEFTFEEMAQISLSQDPTIAALRLLLSSWAGEVWSDDPRVINGLNILESLNIITSERKLQILTK